MIFGRKQGQENKHYNKRKQIRYFNIINIAERWCEIGCTSKTSIINQSWSMQFRLAIFFWMTLLDYINANVSVSLIFKNSQFYLKGYFIRHAPCRQD